MSRSIDRASLARAACESDDCFSHDHVLCTLECVLVCCMLHCIFSPSRIHSITIASASTASASTDCESANNSRGSDGIFWLAMISPRNSLIDNLSERPFLRKIIARLPTWLQPAPATHAGVLGINSQGEVVYNIQDPGGKFSQISSVQEWNGHLYFGSLGRDGIGYLKTFQ